MKPNFSRSLSCKSFKLIAITGFMLLLGIGATAQVNAALARKITINNFCLCQTTLTDLKQVYKDLKEAKVEEMDLGSNCIGQDARFIAGKGYYTEKQPGMIFQLDQSSDEISKIRLTKQFKGNLPDGRFINLENFSLKDLLKLYPKIKNPWGSRGCSTYWKFSDDTLSFYIKIDPTKKPQFPIDEAYYLNKPVEGIDLMISCYGVHKDQEEKEELTNNDPVFFVDSVRTSKADLMKYNPKNVAMVTVYKDTNATKIMGNEAKYGLIYIETKQFCKHRYWSYFKSKSSEYSKIVTSPENDANIQYILNKRVLKDNYEGDLASVNDTLFKGIQIINKEQLAKDYGITDKDYGIIILSDKPSNLKNSKDKF